MDKFKTYKLNIWEKEKKLVLQYLEKIKSFTDENGIDIELYNDIEEMVFEKLALEKDFDQLKITRILKEVGEPEVIFSDFVDTKKTSAWNKKSQSEDIFYHKLIEKNWERENDWAIFLWISQLLAQKFGVPVWLVRILFLIFVFVFGLSIWVYFLLWMIFPVKWLDYSTTSLFWYFQKQLYHLVKDFVYNTHKSIVFLIKFIFVKSFKMLGSIIQFIRENIFPIIRFWFFGILSACFAFVLLVLIVVGAFYFSGFSVANMEFFALFPSYFIWGIIFGSISSAVFMVGSFWYGINKKTLHGGIYAFAGCSFLIALFLWISTGFFIADKYVGKWKITSVVEQNISDITEENIVIDIEKLPFFDDIFWISSNTSSIKVQPSFDSNISIKVIQEVLGNDELIDTIQQSIQSFLLEKNWNTLSLQVETGKLFKKKIPYTFFRNEFVISLPVNKKYTINGYNYYFQNAHVASIYWEYQNYLPSNCAYEEIYYSQEEEKFVCNVKQEHLEYAKKQHIKKKVIQDFDTISSLKHKNEFKRNYYNDHGLRSDWNFWRIYFIDEKIIHVEFSDQSLDINAYISYQEGENGIEFTGFEIKNVESNYAYKEKYYEDVTSISSFIWSGENHDWD